MRLKTPLTVLALVTIALGATAELQNVQVGNELRIVYRDPRVVTDDFDPLVRLARDELSRYLNTLPWGEQADDPVTFLVGSTASKLGPLPELGDQEILIRPGELDGVPAVGIVGGSPRATLWAVYELVERWGVRYLVHGDVVPAEPGPLIPTEEIRMTPNMPTRCWRLVNDLALGPVSWSLEENRRFLHQIAKMKYNRVFLSFWPAQPFVHYSFRGIEKPPPVFNFGERYPIDNRIPGLGKFGGRAEFANPDLLAETPEDLVRRAEALAHGIFAQASRLGMEVGMAVQVFDWPKEFAPVLPGAEPVKQLGNLTIGPGHDQSMDDPALRDMVATVFRAYVETYPEADYVHVGMPEHRGWTEQAEQAYNALDAKYGLADFGTFEELCARARARTSFPGGGERVEAMLKGDLASLAFFDSLIEEKDLLKRPSNQPDVHLVYNGVVAELFPLLAKMTPEGGEVLSFVDYTASRQLKQRDLLRQRPPEGFPANLIFTLADDNVGVLPQLATGSMHELLGDLRANGWSGFYTRYWTVGDLDPTVHYLARASWDASLTPDAAYRDLVGGACGPASVGDAVKAFHLVEDITIGLDDHGLGFGFPVPSMMTKHHSSGGLSAAIKQDHASYREALALLQAARAHSLPQGHRFLDYMVARMVFAVRYLDAAEAFGATSTAGKAGDLSAALAHVEDADTAIREALRAWVDVAGDHGDLGAVALMYKYCCHPIREKRDALKQQIAGS